MVKQVTSTLSMVVVLALLTSTASAETKLRVATVMPERDPTGQALARWAVEVRKITKGEVTIQLFFGAQGADDFTLVRKLRNSQIDGVIVGSIGMGLIEKNLRVFELPGLFDSVAKLAKARTALMPRLVRSLAQELRLLGTIDGGMIRWMSKTNPIKTPAMLASAKVFGLSDDSFAGPQGAALGYKPVALSLDVVAGALKKGDLDTLASSALAASQLGYSTEIGQVTDLVVAIETGGLIVRTESLAKLPASTRKLVEDSAAKLTASLTERRRAEDDAAFRALVKRAKLVRLTAAEKVQWAAKYQQVRKDLERSVSLAVEAEQIR